MKDQTTLETVTRRNFNRSILATVVAAPIGLSMACNGEPANDCKCPDGKGQPFKCAVVPEGLEIEPHEPPIGVSNGSLRMECKSNMVKQTVGSGHRPYSYKIPKYTGIYLLQVLTEREKYFTNFFYYLAFYPCYLGLWLQKKAPAGSADPWIPKDTSGEPQVLFTFVKTGQLIEFVLEIDKEFSYADSYKPSRPHRYEHPGYSGEHFRIAKWSLFYPTPANVITGIDGSKFEEDLTLQGSDINGFQLAVTFEHVDHYKNRLNLT